jgi:hypothetical protein
MLANRASRINVVIHDAVGTETRLIRFTANDPTVDAARPQRLAGASSRGGAGDAPKYLISLN